MNGEEEYGKLVVLKNFFESVLDEAEKLRDELEECKENLV